MSIAESLLNVLDSCSLSEATKKKQNTKKNYARFVPRSRRRVHTIS